LCIFDVAMQVIGTEPYFVIGECSYTSHLLSVLHLHRHFMDLLGAPWSSLVF
jgi:hypothetical protein